MSFEFTRDNFEKLSEFIYATVGIYLSKDKHYNKLSKLINNVSERGDANDFREYFTAIKLGTNAKLFEELINTITVNETYFFRENHQFETLTSIILQEISSNKKSNEGIRILSAPCSTGEEPYSIAIHILEQGSIVNERDIEIVGIDIDSNCIEKARNGAYTKRSLRVMPQNLTEKYFSLKEDSLYYLDEQIKNAIKFEQVNIFNKEQVRKLGKFDIIFSRNMLIYFDDASQKEVVLNFYDMLNYGGYILLGHAEYMSRIAPIFSPIRHNESLVYKKE